MHYNKQKIVHSLFVIWYPKLLNNYTLTGKQKITHIFSIPSFRKYNYIYTIIYNFLDYHPPKRKNKHTYIILVNHKFSNIISPNNYCRSK